ncbi:hypothetical protein SEA_BBQVALINDRA_41 [Gordonia phage BBQValindra]|nr:hypothetical protein SEA_BBQVALINDRA_41 [Gordonia phage BBQValindra]
MPFVTPLETARTLLAPIIAGVPPTLALVLGGNRFELFALRESFWDVVVRVQGDPALEGYGALSDALQVVGIRHYLCPVVLGPEYRALLVGRDVEDDACGYAVLAWERGDQRGESDRLPRRAEHLGQGLDFLRAGHENALIGPDVQAGLSGLKHAPSVGGGQ